MCGHVSCVFLVIIGMQFLIFFIFSTISPTVFCNFAVFITSLWKCVYCVKVNGFALFKNEPNHCYISDLCICMVIVWSQIHTLFALIHFSLPEQGTLGDNKLWSDQSVCVLAEAADSYNLFCHLSAFLSSSVKFQPVVFLFGLISPFTPSVMNSTIFDLFYFSILLSSMQDIASWIDLLLSIYCCHISFPVLSLFPSPFSIFGWFGGVSAQNNNNDHASMSVSIPAWLFPHYTVILQADGRKACICLTVEATPLQACWFIWDRL